MKVCFSSDQSFPPLGGEGISTENFCVRLSQRNHRVTVLTSKAKNIPLVKEIKVYRFFFSSFQESRFCIKRGKNRDNSNQRAQLFRLASIESSQETKYSCSHRIS
jgi:hypothetical protein